MRIRNRLLRLLALSGGTGALAAMVFAAPAAGEVKGECYIDGEVKTQDKWDRHLGTRLVGGEGKFTFATLGLGCVGDSNKDGLPEVDSGLAATATGWFDNTICGTGKAFGTVTQIRGGSPKLQAVVGEEFAIQFQGFVGIFKWRDWDKPDVPTPKVEPDSEDVKKLPHDGTPAGELTLSLAQEKPFPTPVEIFENLQSGNCAKAFRVTGAIAGHFVD